MLDDPVMWRTDDLGRKVAVAFVKNDVAYEIADEAYQNLTQLVDLLLKQRSISESVSTEFLEQTIVDLCIDNLGKDPIGSVCDFLEAKFAKAVHSFVVWIPMENLEVQESFDLGPVRIDTITKEMLDQQEASARIGPAANYTPELQQFYEKLRGDVQGSAAIVVSLRAEANYAFDRAVAIAESAIGLLRCFLPGSLAAYTFIPTAVTGSEYLPRAMGFIYREGQDIPIISKKVRFQSFPWRLSKDQLTDFRKRGLQRIGALVLESGLTEFQRTLRSSLLAFSKGVTFPDINDRLVYTMSALEGLLLRGSEPIQQNLGERMAFILFRDPQARKDTVRNLKEAYSMRSQYIHHRIDSADRANLEILLRNAGFVLLYALRFIDRFNATNQFLDEIDNLKFGSRSNYVHPTPYIIRYSFGPSPK